MKPLQPKYTKKEEGLSEDIRREVGPVPRTLSQEVSLSSFSLSFLS